MPNPTEKRNRNDGSYEGVKGTKTPTGSRPTPEIARNDPMEIMRANVAAANAKKVKAPIKHTPMPTPKMDKDTGRSKKEGGGSYA